MKKIDRPRLEIAAHSLRSARAAEVGGADRIELCTALSTGGLTPDAGLVHLCVQHLSMPVHVLVRPRVGDFIYSASEVDTMAAAIQEVKKYGADGVVIGCLTNDAHIDAAALTVLLGAAAGMHVTFHRAFDYINDKQTALEKLISLGVQRILTSGGAATAWEGRDQLQTLIRQADGRIEVMPGAGVSSTNIKPLHRLLDATSYHASAKQLIETTYQGSLDLGDRSLPRYETDAAEVKRLMSALSPED